MELVFYVPGVKGFKKLCYLSYEVFVQEFGGRDYDYFANFFIDYDYVLVEDRGGKLRLARFPDEVLDIWEEAKRQGWKEEEELKKREEERKKEREEEELPF